MFIRARACPDGMRIGLALETTDRDVMREIFGAFVSWGFQLRLKKTRVRPPARRQGWRIDIRRRAVIEALLSKVRPLSAKNEQRLTPILSYWSERDAHRGRLWTAAALVAAGNTYASAAEEAGVTKIQLSNFLYYERHRGGRSRMWADSGTRIPEPFSPVSPARPRNAR